MKNALKVCIGIVLGALMAFLYFFYKGMQHNVNDTYIPKTPQLRVEVLNHASKPIQRMSIELNNKSKAEFTHLILGDRVYKNFALKGEGGVRIIVEFEDGTKRYAPTSYVEPGYLIESAIYNDSIRVHYR